MDVDLPDDAESKFEGPIILVTDFGTTFSAAAYSKKYSEDGQHRIKMITNYPDDPRALSGKPLLEVPTESWYPNKKQIEQHILDHHMGISDNQPYNDLYDISDHGADQLSDAESIDEAIRPRRRRVHNIDNEIRNFFWGFGIEDHTAADMVHSDFNRIARSKLLLHSDRQLKVFETTSGLPSGE